MSESRRIQRVEKSLREVISSYLLSGFGHELPGFVSVPLVHVSPDLRNAKIYISVFGSEVSEEDRADCLELLNQNRHQVQSHVAKHLKMKFCPKLRFYADEVHQAAMSVENKIREIQSEREKNSSSTDEAHPSEED